MFKFFLLSVLVLGCYSQIFQSHNFGGFRSGYGHYGVGYGQGLNYQKYGTGHQKQIINYDLGNGLGYYNFLPGGYRFDKAYSVGYQYQPITSAYVAQPAVSSVALLSDNLPASQISQVNQVVHDRPTVSFLTHHQSEPHQEVVSAAVTQLGRTVEYKHIPYQEHPIKAQVVEVEPSETPLHIHFKTKSSSVSLSQSHQQREPQEAQITQTQDEPSRLIHEIQKPIVQEVREVITPYRQVTQEIQPTVEAVHTIVSKAEGQRQQYVANIHHQPAAFSNIAVNRQTFVSHPIDTSVAAHPVAIDRQVSVTHPIATVVDAQPVAANLVVQPFSVGFEKNIVPQPVAANLAVQPFSVGFEKNIVSQPVASYGYQQSLISQPVDTISTSAIQPAHSLSISFEPTSVVGYKPSNSVQPFSKIKSIKSLASGSSTSSIRSGSLETRAFNSIDSSRSSGSHESRAY